MRVLTRDCESVQTRISFSVRVKFLIDCESHTSAASDLLAVVSEFWPSASFMWVRREYDAVRLADIDLHLPLTRLVLEAVERRLHGFRGSVKALALSPKGEVVVVETGLDILWRVL